MNGDDDDEDELSSFLSSSPVAEDSYPSSSYPSSSLLVCIHLGGFSPLMSLCTAAAHEWGDDVSAVVQCSALKRGNRADSEMERN